MALRRVTDTQTMSLHDSAMNRKEGTGGCYEALSVSLSKTAPGADLGCGRKHSNESFEDGSGEGFHVKSRTWASLVDPRK